MPTDLWNDVSFVVASKNRRAILLDLENPKTPTMVAKGTNLNVANVSRTLSELEKVGLVVCLTPKKKMGRIYSHTQKGKEVLEKVRAMK